MARVIGIVGGSGGVGASVFAGALAATAAESGRTALIDLDVLAGGIDVTLGIESAVGARWSGVHLAGGGLDPEALLDGIVSWAGSRVLAADVNALDAADVEQVLDCVDLALDTVVLDLPRGPCPARDVALPRCDLVVVVVRGDVAGVVAAHAQVRSLPDVPIGALVRHGEIDAAGADALVGAPLLGQLPRLRGGPLDLDQRRAPRALRDVARGVLGGLVLQGASA